MTINLGLSNQTLVNAYNTGGFQGVQQQLGVDDAAFVAIRPKIVELLVSDSLGTMKADGYTLLDPPESGSGGNVGVLARNLSDMSYGDASFDLTSVLMAFTKSAQSVRESSMKARDASFDASVASTKSGIEQMGIAAEKNYAAAKKDAMMTIVAGATTVASSAVSLGMTTKGIKDDYAGQSAQAQGADKVKIAKSEIELGTTQIQKGKEISAGYKELWGDDEVVVTGKLNVARGESHLAAGNKQIADGVEQQKSGEVMRARGAFAEGAGRGLAQTLQGVGGAMAAEDTHAAELAKVAKETFDLQASIEKEENQQHKDMMQLMLDTIRDTASKAQSMLEGSAGTMRSINTV
jgi:hypothetical protein